MVKKILAVLFLLGLISCSSGGSGDTADKKKDSTFKIALAANMRYAFEDIKKAFKAKTGWDVEAMVTSSGKLTNMIEHGAPYALFLSANMKYPKYLYEKKLALDKPVVYAKGKLVAFSLTEDVSKYFKNSFKSLGSKKIAVAHPDKAPYGVAAVESLKALKLLDKLKENIMYAESISQTNHYIFGKSVVMGFTAFSALKAPAFKGKGHYYVIPSKLYSPILQGAVITKYGAEHNKEKASKLLEFILSPEGKAILNAYGYE